MNSEKKTP